MYRYFGPYRHGNKWRVIGRAANGAQITESFESKGEAERFFAEATIEVQGGLTLLAALDEYEVAYRAKVKASTSYRARAHLNRMFPNAAKPLRWVTPAIAQSLYDELQAKQSVDTHRNALANAKMFCGWCVKRGYLRVNPFADVKGEGRRKKGKPQLHLDEVRAFVQACFAERSQESIAALLCVLLGLRASEAAGIRARDIDDGGRLLWIHDSKTQAGKRALSVPDSDAVPLARALAELAAGAGGGPIFGQRSRYWVGYHVGRLCDAAGVPRVPPHGLRGTIATIATSHGALASAVSAALGHAGTEVTARHYVAPGAKEDAAQEHGLRVLIGGAA